MGRKKGRMIFSNDDLKLIASCIAGSDLTPYIPDAIDRLNQIRDRIWGFLLNIKDLERQKTKIL